MPKKLMKRPLRTIAIQNRMKMTLHKTFSLILFVMLTGVFAFTGCLAEDESAETNANASPTKTPLSEFESEMRSMKTVDFDFIFSFKRKDAEAFSSEDKKFLKEQTYIANRRSLLKDGKTIIIGSNYEIEKKRLDALKERFDYEDFSKPPEKRKKQKEESNSKTNKEKSSRKK